MHNILFADPHNNYLINTNEFVRLVGAIEVAVAAPVQRDAIVVFDTRKFGLRTSDVRAIEFICTVLTVVVSITHPDFLNTLAVATRKFIVPTRFVCREN